MASTADMRASGLRGFTERNGDAMQRINDRLLSWASILEDSTRARAVMTSQLPFIFAHLALMPDAQLGKGSTVGSVIPTPRRDQAVGVDIGCGIIAVRTQYHGAELSGDRNKLHAAISAAVPLSAGKHNTTIKPTATAGIAELESMPGHRQAESAAPNWRLQLGSLGSGNHFIEVSLDEQDRVWLFLHSGSRGVGNKLAVRHIKVAQDRCRLRGVELPDSDLAYLVEEEPEFWTYLEALHWAQRFAYLNREETMARVGAAFSHWHGPVAVTESVHCHHNYTEPDTHFGENVWVSRKGAISARKGQLGLIPGSMGTASYVVVGKANELSLCSSPHGAGRNFSRNAARKRFIRADLDKRMAGIAWVDRMRSSTNTPMLQGHRCGHARCGRAGRDPAQPAPDRQHQGRLGRLGRLGRFKSVGLFAGARSRTASL
jgi:tRNA-splicing ligase RtcB